jgi:hypothetical protein
MGEVSLVDVSKEFTLRIDSGVHTVHALRHVSFTIRRDCEIASLHHSRSQSCGWPRHRSDGHRRIFHRDLRARRIIINAANSFDTAKMFVPIVVLMVLATLLNELVGRIERWVAPWQFEIAARN